MESRKCWRSIENTYLAVLTVAAAVVPEVVGAGRTAALWVELTG